MTTPTPADESRADQVTGADAVPDDTMINWPAADATEATSSESVIGSPSLRTVLEAILLVVDEPATMATLAQIAQRPLAEVAAVVAALAAEYEEQARGFRLREVSGGWRLFTASDCAEAVERYVLDGQTARLTQAALETLAVVAYQQPVSRSRIGAIRGVSVDGVIRTLLGRGLVAETGSDPATGALLYSTTPLFLEKMGLRDLTELPDLAPLLPDLTTFMSEANSIST